MLKLPPRLTLKLSTLSALKLASLWVLKLAPGDADVDDSVDVEVGAHVKCGNDVYVPPAELSERGQFGSTVIGDYESAFER